jgi:hypothetical protein
VVSYLIFIIVVRGDMNLERKKRLRLVPQISFRIIPHVKAESLSGTSKENE